MLNELRTVYYDTELQIEAYRFEGIMQKFSHHFHDYYVIGFIEYGQRYLLCQNQEYIINPGDIVIFNPGDIYSCEQLDGKTLDYRQLASITVSKYMLPLYCGEQKMCFFSIICNSICLSCPCQSRSLK